MKPCRRFRTVRSLFWMSVFLFDFFQIAGMLVFGPNFFIWQWMAIDKVLQ